MEYVEIFKTAISSGDLVISLIILYALLAHTLPDNMGFGFKFGFWLAAMGMLYQGVEGLYFTHTGAHLFGKDVPLHMFEDLGLWLLGASFICKDRVSLIKVASLVIATIAIIVYFLVG